jgi:integrase
MEDSAVPRLAKIPSYRLHKPSGKAIVVIRNRMYYLGKYGSAESKDEYSRIIAEWAAQSGDLLSPRPRDRPGEVLTITELASAYWAYVIGYYVKDGEATSEAECIRQALKPVRRIYGHTLAKDFGPLALKTVRSAMIAQGWARNHVNRQTNRVKRMFSWATSEEILPVTIYQSLKTVEGLRRGRTTAKEKPPIAPVSDAVVEETIKHLRPTVAAMVRIQRLTGMRPQEVVGMRVSEIDMSDPECWVYIPGRHKTEHHGRERVIFLGPRAQRILEPFIRTGDTFIFSPQRAESERNSVKSAQRKTPRWPSHMEKQARMRKAQPKRAPRERYDVPAYRRAVKRACDAAFPHPTLNGVPADELNEEQSVDLTAWLRSKRWHPNRLRHSFATVTRHRFGVEAAQACLGHAEIDTTQIYAARNLKAARSVALEIG